MQMRSPFVCNHVSGRTWKGTEAWKVFMQLQQDEDLWKHISNSKVTMHEYRQYLNMYIAWGPLKPEKEALPFATFVRIICMFETCARTDICLTRMLATYALATYD